MSRTYLFTLLLSLFLTLPRVASGAAFTDESLRVFLETNASGMILVWSPDMPLSALALEEAPGVAQALRIELKTISSEEMKSARLSAMGILNHFPAIVLFRDGELIPFLVQGYEIPESLIQILGEKL